MAEDYIVARPEPLGMVCLTNARDRPGDIAITENGATTSWAQLHARSQQVAHGLAALGARPGDHVAMLSRNRGSMFELLHGNAWAGTIFTPVNWRLAPAEIDYILNDSEAEILFVSAEAWAHILPIRDRLTRLKHVIFFDGAVPGAGEDYTAWRDAQPTDDVEGNIDPEAAVIQLYTSGTTGRPKGALIPHRYFMVAGEMLRDQREEIYKMRRGEELLHYLPMFHLGGTGMHYHPAIRGCGVIVLPDFDAGEVLRLTSQHRVPLFYGVPSMFQMLLGDPRMAATDFSDVRCCIYGAAPITYALRDRLMEVLGCGFAQHYGMTEVCFVSCLEPEDHLGEATKIKSVGRPMPGVTVKIVDPDGCELPTGEIGEIAVLHPGLMLGYWKLPEATASVLRDGWYMTGDGGYVDEDGYLFLKDRIKDMIISGGENIYPQEVENVLARHPAVAGVAVVSIADELWGEVVKAFIVLKPGLEARADDLHLFASQSLGGFKLPKYYEFVAEFPLTGSGKVMKFELRSRSNDRAVRVKGRRSSAVSMLAGAATKRVGE